MSVKAGCAAGSKAFDSTTAGKILIHCPHNRQQNTQNEIMFSACCIARVDAQGFGEGSAVN
eukprot:5473151-Amphidinium_carterae.1